MFSLKITESISVQDDLRILDGSYLRDKSEIYLVLKTYCGVYTNREITSCLSYVVTAPMTVLPHCIITWYASCIENNNRSCRKMNCVNQTSLKDAAFAVQTPSGRVKQPLHYMLYLHPSARCKRVHIAHRTKIRSSFFFSTITKWKKQPQLTHRPK